MFKFLMVQLRKSGHYIENFSDMKSFIRAYCLLNKDKFSEKDKTSIIVPSLKVMNFPENVVEALLPSIPDLTSENLEKYIAIKSNAVGSTLSKDEEEKIISNLKSVGSSKLPSLIRTMIDANISSYNVWNLIRESLISHYKNKESSKMIAESLISMNQHMREKSFLNTMRPFVIDNIDQFDLESLIKVKQLYLKVIKLNSLVLNKTSKIYKW